MHNRVREQNHNLQVRRETLVDGKRIVTGMVACRVPIVAAVNGPAVGLGCSIVALSDIVFMAESAHLADPHVLVGHPELMLGSYPEFSNAEYKVKVTLESKDKVYLDRAVEDLLGRLPDGSLVRIER